ncbi:MAG: hypothetical protein LAO55_26785 [Acidobacteriia bacterium]|nr:hypothetical protein [Terriglobia bacterium]
MPVSRSVVEALASLRARGNFTGPDELVFASREGTPLNEQIGMALSDRQAQMGHGDVRMMHYTHSDIERRRAGVEAISEKLTVTPSTAELTGCDPK